MSQKKQKKYYNKRKKESASSAAVSTQKNAKKAASVSAATAKRKKTPPPSPLFDTGNIMEIFARVFLIAMAIVFPLTMGAEKYANITHFKNTAYYLIAALAFSAIIITLLIKTITTPAYEFNPQWPKFTKTDIAVLLYWGFLLISALLSPYKDVAFNGQGVRNDGLIIQAFYVATYFALSRLLRLHKFDLNIYCLGATVVAALVMFHFFGIDLLETGFTQPNWESGLLFMGPMGNINLTSYFVTVALTVAAAIFITRQQLDFDKYGAVTLGCFAVMLWAELNLNTDAGIVALAVVVLFSLPLMLISLERVGRFFTLLSVALAVMIFNRLVVNVHILEEDFGRTGIVMLTADIICIAAAIVLQLGLIKAVPSRKALLIVTLSINGLAVIGALIVAFIAAESQKKGVLYEFGQMLYHHNFNDKFGSKRIFTWKRTLKLAGEHPLFGSGPDTFCNVFNETYGDESSKFFNGRNLDKAHNEYLQLLICSGITGLGAFLAFLGTMFVKAFRRAQDNPLLVCCAAGVAAYAVHAFFGYSLPINSPLMWVLFGLTGAAIRCGEPAGAAAKK